MSCGCTGPIIPYGPWAFGWGPWGPYAWSGACMPARSNCPPSQQPPWSRAVQSPVTQTLVQAGNIDLTTATTFLNQTVNNPPNPVAVALPNGNFIQQTKSIYIQGSQLATTETFIVAGTFAGGFGHLVFNGIGFSAVLMWDGTSWQLISGNAQLQP